MNPAVFPSRARIIPSIILGLFGTAAAKAATLNPIPDQLWFDGARPPQLDVTFADPVPPETQIIPRLARASSPFPGMHVTPVGLGSSAFRLFFENYPQAGTYRIELTATNHLATNRLTFGILVKPRLFGPVFESVQGAGAPLELVDINGDGYPELVGPAAVSGNRPRIGSNQKGILGRTGSASPIASDATVWDDFDGDGRPDPITFSVAGARSVFWMPDRFPVFLPPNAPDLSLQFVTPVPVTLGASALSGYFDGDGDRDIILISPPGGKPEAGVYLGRNRGTGEMDYERIADPVPNAAAAAGDIDGDGDLDLVMASLEPDGTRTLAIWINDGRGHFARSPIRLPTGNFAGVGLADFDGDGRLDLWTEEHIPGKSTAPQTNRLAVLLANADGFRESWATETPIGNIAPATAAACDFDGDGFPDLAGLGSWDGGPSWFVFLNDGRGRFTPSAYLGNYGEDGRPAVGDYNGDSRPDLALGRGTTFFGGNFTNGIPSFNIPPSAPTGPRSRLDGTRLALEWDAATDLNQPGALTYNVRAGFGPGMHDLVPSLARADGVRQVTRPGNAGFRTSLELDLSNRPGQTVYWSVQAIDAGGQGGPFSEERVQHVRDDATAPVFAGLHDISMLEDNTGALAFEVFEPGVAGSDIVVEIVEQPPDMPGFAWVSTNKVTDHNRHVVWARAPHDVNGIFPIAIAATDPMGISTTNRLLVTVTPVNDAPRIGGIRSPPRNVYAGEPLPPILVEVQDPETPIGDLTFAVTDTLGLIPSDRIVLGIAATNLLEISTPDYPLSADDVLHLSVTDPQGLTAKLDMPFKIVPRWFEEFSVFPGPVSGHLFALGDYDGDGLPDLLGTDGYGLMLWHNEGTNDWSGQPLELPADFGLNRAQWDDWDRDGRLDVVCIGSRCIAGGCESSVPAVCVLYNRPEGWVAGPVQSPAASPFYIASVADIDDDGSADVVGWTPTEGTRRFMTAFRREESFIVSGDLFSSDSASVGILDLDLDGRTDIVPGTGANGLFHWTGTDWGTSALRWEFEGTPMFGDLDRDGRWDAVLAPYSLAVPTPQYLPALGSYRSSPDSPFPPLTATAFRDFDGDGFPDALTREGNPGIRRGNRGKWGHTVAIHSYPASEWIDGDIDGDGKTDIVLLVPGALSGGIGSPRIVVLRNVLAPDPDPRPVAPSDVHVVFESDGAALEWSRRPDEIARGITYNIRVGTAPGLGDVVSPLAKADGTRSASGPGNAGISPRRRIARLALGRTYYTAVQCIDDAGRGGRFSTEIAFVPTQHTLAIDAPETVSVAVDSSELSIAFDVTGAMGDVSATATFGPAALAGTSLPTATVTNGHGVARVAFGIRAQGRGHVTIVVTDGSRSIARRTVAIVRGEPPPGVDIVVVRSLATRIDHPVAFDADPRSLDPERRWLSENLTEPLHGTTQTDFPSGYYIPPPGYAGTDQFAWTVITGDGDRLFERFDVEVAGSGGTQIYLTRKDGGWDLFLVAAPSETGTLEVSDDLRTWRPLMRYAAPASGSVFLHSVAGIAGEPAAFYRRVPDHP